jgi:hypothetical protein
MKRDVAIPRWIDIRPPASAAKVFTFVNTVIGPTSVQFKR